jgi:hypothetical protein
LLAAGRIDRLAQSRFGHLKLIFLDQQQAAQAQDLGVVGALLALFNSRDGGRSY